MFSHIIQYKRSRRELIIDGAEHRSILKNNQNTFYLRFSFTPKTGLSFPKTGVLFLLSSVERNEIWAMARGYLSDSSR